MYAALFEMSSWMGLEKYIFQGMDASDLLEEFEDVQSLHCLVRMGRSEEGPEGQKALDVIEDILDKRDSGDLTVEDLLKLDVKTSLGTIKCCKVQEGDDAFEQLKAEYPEASAQKSWRL